MFPFVLLVGLVLISVKAEPLPAARLDVRIDPTLGSTDFTVTIWASAPAEDVRATVSGLRGTFDENGFPLEPGKPRTSRVFRRWPIRSPVARDVERGGP